MSLTTPRFRFLDIKNFLAPGMSYEKWCKSLECKLEKLVFPLRMVDELWKTQSWRTCNTQTLLQQSKWEKNTLSSEEYEEFCAEFRKRECVTMIDWLREYNLADVVPFVEAVKKTVKKFSSWEFSQGLNSILFSLESLFLHWYLLNIASFFLQ